MSARVPDSASLGPRARSFERAHWEWAFRESQRGGRAFSCAVIVVHAGVGVAEHLRSERIAAALVEIERSTERLKASHEILFGAEGDRAYLAVLAGDGRAVGCLADEIVRGARAPFQRAGWGVGLEASVGVASNQAGDAAGREGLFLETLLAVAADGAEVAQAGGGGPWIHTELYGLVQGRLESRGFCAPPAAQQPTPRHGALPVLLPQQPAEPRAEERIERPIEQAADPSATEPSVEAVVQAEEMATDNPLWNAPSEAAGANGDGRSPGSTAPKGSPAVGHSADGAASQGEEERVGWREILPKRARSQDAVVRPEELPPGGGDGLVGLVFAALKRAGLKRSEAFAAEGALLPLLVSYVDAQRKQTAEEVQARVQLLERRVLKLRRRLEELERSGPLLPADGGDGGVRSTFREVQGLSPVDGQFQLKSQLLEAILQANLELAACTAHAP